MRTSVEALECLLRRVAHARARVAGRRGGRRGRASAAAVRGGRRGQPRVWRLTRTIAIAFGLLALAIAGIGLYALLAQAVLARRYELAVRAALGARPVQLSRLVLREAVLLAAAATAAGLLLAIPAIRLLASLEVHSGRLDRAGLAGVIALLLAVSTIASLLPALRAARSAPAAVLRSE